jgi:transaldolase
MYVESLIGPCTIATVPPDTLRRFEDHSRISNALVSVRAADARRMVNALTAGGIDLTDVNRTLEEEGIQKFRTSFENLLGAIAHKRRAMFHRTLKPEILP